MCREAARSYLRLYGHPAFERAARPKGAAFVLGMDQHRGHRLSKLYFYFNLPNREDDDELPERELYALDTAGYTIDLRRKAGLRVQCEEIGPANLAAVSAPIAVRTMMAIAEMEHQSASARTRAYLGRAKNEGQALGRPASLNSQQQTRILERLARGA